MNADATLDGLTITNCNAEPGNGGGMLIENASPTVKHCKIESNAAFNGGGIYLTNSSARIIDCRFYQNDIVSSGIHIYNLNADSLFEKCEFLEPFRDIESSAVHIINRNSEARPTFKKCAFQDATRYGGGVYNDNASPEYIDCDFTDFNGGIFGLRIMINIDASPLIKNCRFENNQWMNGSVMRTTGDSSPSIIDCTFAHNASSKSYGGMFNFNGTTPLIRGCLFEYNAGVDSAAINNNGADAIIENCIFRFNGGGLGNVGTVDAINCAPVVRNCIFYQNSSPDAGAMVCDNAAPHIVNCVFYKNSGTVAGAIVSQNNANPLITNCIFGENGIPGEPVIFGPAVVTYSDILGGYSGQGNIDADPLFLNPANGDFHISTLSPCVDKGTADVPYLPDTDFEGDSRIRGLAPDMGADET